MASKTLFVFLAACAGAMLVMWLSIWLIPREAGLEAGASVVMNGAVGFFFGLLFGFFGINRFRRAHLRIWNFGLSILALCFILWVVGRLQDWW